jgi:spore cortex formation protein SpoVR/YcgB (stage V sporulation)
MNKDVNALIATKPLFDGADWDAETIKRAYEAIEDIALNELGLDVYPNQIEIITSEQMLDAYASIGLPIMYRHWSFGKRFVRDEMLYRKGYQGLAYEIVINSNPCISYIMEENSMTMQTLVLAHAAFGHNHFFKNNYLFRQWTDADGILDYLAFARDYIARCEEQHGYDAVERVLDAAHALMDHGVNRYARHPKTSLAQEKKRAEERRLYEQQTYNDLWRTLPVNDTPVDSSAAARAAREAENRRKLGLPEENLLLFIEKQSPKLEGWQREIVRIVRKLAQYFYPQKQTRMMNEGCATFVHYEIMLRLHDRGLLTEGAMLEFLQSHTNVVAQPDFDSPRYSGINPYALGFAMMQDIKRICIEPTEEDRHCFPGVAGNGDPYGTLRDGWANYRDESFILQFLSPTLIRKFRLFKVTDEAEEPTLLVDAIHDEVGYQEIRRALARQFDLSRREPDIQIADVDLAGDRCLVLKHAVYDGVMLEEKTCSAVLRHVATLWTYNVRLLEVDAVSDSVLRTYEASPEGEA